MDNSNFGFQPQPGTAQPITPPNLPSAGQTAPPQIPPQFNPTAARTARPSTGFIVALVLTGLFAAVFAGLFIWMFVQWDEVKTDVDGKIDAAVATAIGQKTIELGKQCNEEKKSPYVPFAGPVDYGELNFVFPKTWSLYEANPVRGNDDYLAYLNPGKVTKESKESRYALRVSILNQLSERVIESYDKKVSSGDLKLTVHPVNGENANIYTGKFSDEVEGIAAVFRIRDKTVVLQTDSSKVFGEEFFNILKTVKYNK